MKRKIWIVTLFPDYFTPFLNCGIAGSALRGERQHQLELKTVSLREFTLDNYKGVDDSPYGGGAGMVMRADVLLNAIEKGIVLPGGYNLNNFKEELHFVYTGPRGKVFNSKEAKIFSSKFDVNFKKDLVFICGRYEGIDERFLENYIDETISVGDFILTGGEIPVMLIIDASLRFVDGVLGNKKSSESESFEESLLEHPQYTRPKEFENKAVPEVLLSGNHEKIKEFRKSECLRITKMFRPDLLKKL